MTALQAALLGIIQGLTEFLPISSSAHLILARAFFGWESGGQFDLAFDVACHVGTLVAVGIYFRSDIGAMVLAVTDPAGWSDAHGPSKLLRSLVIGTVPIMIVGVTLADIITRSLRTPQVAGASLAMGAVAMLFAERVGRQARNEETLSTGEALGLGLAQAAALIPGVSRSGAVLTVAMVIGLDSVGAARFAFLLGIPAIMAAAGLAAIDLAAQGIPHGAPGVFAVGIMSSSVVGYFTVKYFIRYVSRYSLDLFAAYRLALAGCVLFWIVWS